jgi:hypothetical protein
LLNRCLPGRRRLSLSCGVEALFNLVMHKHGHVCKRAEIKARLSLFVERQGSFDGRE